MFIRKTFSIALVISSALALLIPPKTGADFSLAVHQSLFTWLSSVVRDLFVQEISQMKIADMTYTIPPLFTIPHIPSSDIEYQLKKIKVHQVGISPESNINLKDKVAELHIKDVGFKIIAQCDVSVTNYPRLKDSGELTMSVKGGSVHSLIKMGSNLHGGIEVAMENTNVDLSSLEVEFNGSAIMAALMPLINQMVRPILTTAISLIVEKVVPTVFNIVLANQLSIGLGLPNGEAWDVHTDVVDSPTIAPDGISIDIALITKHTD